MRVGRRFIAKSRFSGCDNTTDAMALEEVQWLPADLFLLRERLSPLAKLCKGSRKQWQAPRRVATGAVETLLEDFRWVREASTYYQPEPWINFLEQSSQG